CTSEAKAAEEESNEVIRRNQHTVLFPISAILEMARSTTASPNSQIALSLSILCPGSNDDLGASAAGCPVPLYF
ncbi:MAG: hypothetical protein SO294_06590, partial [Prevotella sp.]|nr:hypothetical protein [Prevotella sp.]